MLWVFFESGIGLGLCSRLSCKEERWGARAKDSIKPKRRIHQRPRQAKENRIWSLRRACTLLLGAFQAKKCVAVFKWLTWRIRATQSSPLTDKSSKAWQKCTWSETRTGSLRACYRGFGSGFSGGMDGCLKTSPKLPYPLSQPGS